MKKRILSMVLVISTLLSLCCISVYAKAPGVTTLEPDDITEDSVVLRGTVTSNSGIRIKEYGFQLVYQGNVSTYRFYDGEDYEYPDPINDDVIEYEVDGLRDSSEYAVIFYAVNYDGEKNFGKSVYFETDGDDEEPEITKLKSSAGSEFEEGTEVTFSASAEDNNEVEKIYIFIDGKVVAQKSSDSVKYTTDELEAGEYEIAAMAEDASGNESDVEYLEITVTEKDDGYYNSDYYEDVNDKDYDYEDDDDEDSYIVQQPVKLSTPNAKADRYTIYEGETVTVSWNSISNADYYTVWDLTRNVPYNNITSTSCYSIAPFNEEGTYAIGVYARSYENNLYLQSEACTFNITVVEKEIADTSKPQINTISSSAGKSFAEGTLTTFSTRASDNALSVIYMYIDGEKVETSYYETIEYETSYLDAGSHTIKVVARDESGNESYTSITVTVEEEYEENDDYYEDDYYDYDSGYTDVSVFHNQAYSDASYYGGIKVYVNGSQLCFDVEPEITNGRTMVPLRAIFEALGAEVYWNGSTSTVTAYRDNESVELTIGSYYLYTSNGTKTLDQPGYVINGRTLVPVRAISEAFNCDVEWYGDKQLVSIVAKDKEYQVISSNGKNYNNSAESIILDVPLFKQNDTRWKNVKIGDKTIGAIGCTTTAIAMIYSYNNDNITLPNDMRYKLSYSNNDLLWDSLKNVGLSSKEYNSSANQSMLSTIYQKLDAGKPVIIGAITNSGDYQHWVVITGYIGSNTASLSTSDFVVNDPGTQCSETLSEFLANGDKTDRTKIKRIIY